MPTVSSRRRPWPWDARVWATPPLPGVPNVIGNFRGTTVGSHRGTPIGKLRSQKPSWSAITGTGLMFLPQQNGILVGKKQTIVESVMPINQAYDSAPVYKERTFIFKPTAGMGERQQSSTNDRRYHFALDCWIIGGLFGKGPFLHHLVPPATGTVRQFVDGLSPSGRTPALFLLAGGNVDMRNDDTSAGHVVVINRAATAQSAVRFMSLGTTPVDAVYVAWSDGVLTQIGPTNVTCTLPTGMAANFVEKIGRELWIADAMHSTIRSTNNDPTLAGSWSGPIQVGDASVPITCLRAAGGKLWILKANGDVYSVNADGSDNDWFPSERVPLDTSNGLTAAAWLGSLWYRAGPTFYKMDPSPNLQPIGPERNMSNASEVQGPVQAFVGWGAHLAFCGIYNPTGAQTATGQPTSYLLTYGNWEPAVDTQPTGPSLAFVDQYDGAIAHWPNKRISALYVTSVTNPVRLCVGFDDGTYDWILLVPNPLTIGSGAEFTVGPSSIFMPIHTDMFEANKKQFVAVSAFGPRVSYGDTATGNYRIRGSTGAPGPMGNTDWHAISPPMSINGMRVDLPANIAGIACEFRFDLDNNSDSTHTPVFEGFGIHERVVPDFRYDWTVSVNAADWVARKNGSGVRQSGRQIRDVLQQIAGQPQLATVELPDETIQGLAFVQYQERMLPHDGPQARYGQQFAIDLQLTQFSSEATIGIIERLRGNTIGSLRGYAISALRTM